MGVLVQLVPWTEQPPQFSRANFPGFFWWAGGFSAQDTSGSMVWNAALNPITGKLGSGTGSLSGNSKQLDSFGSYILFDNTGTGTLASTDFLVGDANGSGMPRGDVFTLNAEIYVPSASVCVVYGPDASGGIAVQIDGSTQKVRLIKAWVAAIGDSSGAVPLAKWVHIAVSYDGSTAKFYINGLPSGSASGSQTFTRQQHTLGKSVTDRVPNGTRMRYVAIHDSIVLSDTEVLEIARNPWSLFEP